MVERVADRAVAERVVAERAVAERAVERVAERVVQRAVAERAVDRVAERVVERAVERVAERVVGTAVAGRVERATEPGPSGEQVGGHCSTGSRQQEVETACAEGHAAQPAAHDLGLELAVAWEQSQQQSMARRLCVRCRHC